MATQVDLKLLLYNKNFELIGTSDNIDNNIGRVEIMDLLPNTTYEQGNFIFLG
ncbi:major tail protein [Staphylococcus phage Alsa_3]|nr:major tail protein [Staphylococcus phage Alsa_3]WNM51232.1 major tail protein [Staphylococcus phage Alsa_4]